MARAWSPVLLRRSRSMKIVFCNRASHPNTGHDFTSDLATNVTGATAPITEMVVNSLITSHDNGATASANGFVVEGVAWDRGRGIRSVEISFDGGVAWVPAQLGKNLGNYSFRPFSLRTGRLAPGRLSIMARATSNSGEKQAEKLKFNPAGYNNNVPLSVSVTLA